MKKLYKYINENKLIEEIDKRDFKILIKQWKDDIQELEQTSNVKIITDPYLDNPNLQTFHVKACLEDMFLLLGDSNISRFLTNKFYLK